MKGKEIRSVILDKTNKKKEGGENSYLENTIALLAVMPAYFQCRVRLLAFSKRVFTQPAQASASPPLPLLDKICRRGWACMLAPLTMERPGGFLGDTTPFKREFDFPGLEDILQLNNYPVICITLQ